MSFNQWKCNIWKKLSKFQFPIGKIEMNSIFHLGRSQITEWKQSSLKMLFINTPIVLISKKSNKYIFYKWIIIINTLTHTHKQTNTQCNQCNIKWENKIKESYDDILITKNIDKSLCFIYYINLIICN